MKVLPIVAVVLALIPLFLTGCQARVAEGEPPKHEGAEHAEHGHPQHRILVTTPNIQDVVLTQPYVCQIHSRRHIELRALVGGYLDKINIREGQHVKKDDVLFEILPVLYEAKLHAEQAEANFAEVELEQSQKLYQQKFVSAVDVRLHAAKLANAQAQASLAGAELKFTKIKAPFDGIVDHLYEFKGSLIEEGDILTTLSDNHIMWVYFNVPEARYLEYMANHQGAKGDKAPTQDSDAGPADRYLGRMSEDIGLKLANGKMFPHYGKIGAIEAQFNNKTGNIHFRADFPNPKGLLRHGQTGTVELYRTLHNAIVIPQRAMFEILAKQYVWVVDKEGVVHIREINVEGEIEDLFIVKKRTTKTGPGLVGNEKIIFEGKRQVRDGDKIEYEYLAPEKIFDNLKYHAE